MISFIGNRPAIQVGPYQVIDYGTAWLDEALRRAAADADQDDFPFVDEIRRGVVEYLETRCSLRLLRLEDLFDRVRRMLAKIGCERIASALRPLSPPLSVSLVRPARTAGNGFELAFFEALRGELSELRALGAEEVHFTGLDECAMILCGAEKWNKRCETLLGEIEAFLGEWRLSHARCTRLHHCPTRETP